MPTTPAGTSSVLGTVTRSAAELAAELRRDFDRAMLARYGQAPAQDPVLGTLFLATAAQLARIYEEAEQVFPEAVFDDLVSGLGMPPRAALPAQTVVGFTRVTEPELLTADTPLNGSNRQGEEMHFALDVPVRLAPTSLAFLGAVEGGRLHALTGATIPGTTFSLEQPGLPLEPGSVALPTAAAGMTSTLLLAFDVGDAHLSGLGLYFDIGQADHPLASALARSAWYLLDGHGVARESLVLRSRMGSGGVRLLEWQDGTAPTAGDALATRSAASVPVGAYGPLCWVWPEVPVERRFRSAAPRALAPAISAFVGPEHAAAYERPLAWVQVQLPAGVRGIAAALQRVIANAAPASNLEAYAERVNLDRLGQVVTFRPEGKRARHVIGVLSISGEQGGRYAEETDLLAVPGQGRYRFRGSELDVRAARGPTGRYDRYVMARMLYTDGARANALEPGDVCRLGAPLANVAAQIANVVVSRGGSGPPSYANAKVRFAELLRTRERVITPADYDVVARAFEPRVADARVTPRVEVAADRVPRRVEQVEVRVRAGDFSDPDAELPRLAAQLEAHLQARAPLGSTVRVTIALDARATPRGRRSVP